YDSLSLSYDVLVLLRFLFYCSLYPRALLPFPTRRSSDLSPYSTARKSRSCAAIDSVPISSRNSVPRSASSKRPTRCRVAPVNDRSEEHTSELQSRENLVCRLLLEKKKQSITW